MAREFIRAHNDAMKAVEGYGSKVHCTAVACECRQRIVTGVGFKKSAVAYKTSRLTEMHTQHTFEEETGCIDTQVAC